MINLIGKHGKDCKIFANDLDEETTQAIYSILNSNISDGVPVRIMPDCHIGKDCIVGLTLPITNKINPSHIGVDIGCLDCNTEVLTPKGWIKISEYNNEKILQYNPSSNTGSFLKPNFYIKKSCDFFYHYENLSRGLDQMVSEEHNLLVYHNRDAGRYKKMNPIELVSNTEFNRFRTCFKISQQEGISNMSNEMIKVDIMTTSIGIFKVRGEKFNEIELLIKNPIKAKKAKELLNAAGIDYEVDLQVDKYTRITYKVNKYFINGKLTKYYEATFDQLEVLSKECLYWNMKAGRIKDYISKDKENSDVIQFAFLATDNRADISEDSKGNTICTPLKNKYAGYSRGAKIVPSEDGFKYCFNTETGYFLCRRSGFTFLTGNCGVATSISKTKIPENNISLDKIDYKIRSLIPMGMEVHKRPVVDEKDLFRYLRTEYSKARSIWPEMIPEIGEINEKFVKKMLDRLGMSQGLFYKSLGTLGGGNHFIEVSETPDKIWAITVHCGSRNFGVKVWKYWKTVGNTVRKDNKKLSEAMKITESKYSGKLLVSKLKALKNNPDFNVKNENGLLYNEDMKGYLSDVCIAQAYASYNRYIILKLITTSLRWKESERIESVHNYIDFNDHILRKGSIRSIEGETLVIPLNMADGILVCKGKSNEDWNFSAPHGSGRKFSRGEAKTNITLDEFKEKMSEANVFSTSICKDTLDESPMAYKNSDEIIALIGDTVDVKYRLKPLINLKSTNTLDRNEND